MRRLMVMFGLWWLVALIVAGYTVPALTGGPERDNPFRREYEKMLYPTVRITAGFSTGSGVIFHHRDAEDAENTIYILTACHVVRNESTVKVEIYDYLVAEIRDASVVMTDTVKDLALLRVLCVSAVKPARLAPRDYKPYIFTPVWVVGCSLGFPPRPCSGHLSALCVSAVNNNWEISAPILPGNSGGPVYDARTYQVIGIAVWVHTYNNQLITTMGGIVPISEVHKFLQSAGAVY